MPCACARVHVEICRCPSYKTANEEFCSFDQLPSLRQQSTLVIMCAFVPPYSRSSTSTWPTLCRAAAAGGSCRAATVGLPAVGVAAACAAPAASASSAAGISCSCARAYHGLLWSGIYGSSQLNLSQTTQLPAAFSAFVFVHLPNPQPLPGLPGRTGCNMQLLLDLAVLTGRT